MNMKTKISLKYANSVVLESVVTELKQELVPVKNRQLVASLGAEMIQYGFVPTKELIETLEVLSEEKIVNVHNVLLSNLKNMKGTDVTYDPFYPNFPQQGMEASNVELFLNAIIYYLTEGRLRPVYEKLPRKVEKESTKLQEIGVITEKEFKNIFTMLLNSHDSISAFDKKTIEWFFDNEKDLTFPKEIPFKENLCYVAGIMFKKGVDISLLLSTTTDVLRVATYLSDGDISLAENTKFKSLPREVRRELVRVLNNVIKEEDIERHRNKWVRLFHNLHVGEYRDAERVLQIASKTRNNKKLRTFNGNLQAVLDKKDYLQAVNLLKTRPGEFARKIDYLVRSSDNKKNFLIDSFLSVVDQVPTRNLLQLLGNLKSRNEDLTKKVVFPKGNAQRARVIVKDIPKLSSRVIKPLMTGIIGSLTMRFGKLEPMGKVWIDPELEFCPVPSQQRSVSEGLFQVARGTRLPIGTGNNDQNTLRLFIYWIGEDIDLSATLHNNDLEKIEQISYTRLRSEKYESCHSGDITHAPNGAAEFIDITMDKAAKYGARYVVMNVLVYYGPTFKEHKKVYAGWMVRSRPQSNEIFEPKTVQQKVDLQSNSRNCIPVVFDLVERKAIWTDLTTPRYSQWGGNNVESNRATIRETLDAIINSTKYKVTLYELFKMHALARGEMVEDREEADVIFSPYEGITPYNIALINSDFIV